MANIQIPSIPAAVSTASGDLLVIRQGSLDKSLDVNTLKTFILGGRNFTAQEILDLLKTVDGTGSELDADLLDSQEGAFYRNASNLNTGTIPQARLSASTLLSLLLTVDGPGSGLNSDLLDNQDSSFYRNASNLNAGTVSSSRLPSATTTARGVAEIATTSEATVGTDNSRIITPFLLQNILSSVGGIGGTVVDSTNGYIRFPDSLENILIQWGRTGFIPDRQSETVTFPIAFLSRYVLSATAENNTTASHTAQGAFLSNSQAIIRHFDNDAGSSARVFWIAIGKGVAD